MKLHYYPETDSLYIELSDRQGADSRAIADGLVADLDGEGNVVGIDIDHDSQKIDLHSLDTSELPLKASEAPAGRRPASGARSGRW